MPNSALPEVDYADERRDVIQSARLLMQKAFLEQERREAVVEARESLTGARISRLTIANALAECDRIIEERKENVRLAEEALASTAVSFDGAALDWADTVRRDCRTCMPTTVTEAGGT